MMLFSFAFGIFAEDASAENITLRNEGSLSKRAYGPGERMVLRGYLFTATVNSSNGTAAVYGALVNATLNITIYNATQVNVSNFTLNTSAEGLYYSQSDYDSGGRLITAPGRTGSYYLLLTYKNQENVSNLSVPFRMDFSVVNQSVDDLRVYSDKVSYYTWETMTVTVESVRQIGDTSYAVANLSIGGSLRRASRDLVSSFNCTTGGDGRCSVSGISVPSSVGSYILEVSNYSGVSGFRVVAYDAAAYMKDDSGVKYKTVFNPGQEANVEVVAIFNGTTPVVGTYTFTGNVTNASGSVIQPITSTTLSGNNSYTNRFKFLLNNNFTNGNYIVRVRVVNDNNVAVIRSTSFQVRDWGLSIAKAETDSGFDYEYSAFPGKLVAFDIFPVERLNGTLLSNLTQVVFNISLKNSLGVLLNSSNSTTFNATCGQQGCYKYSILLPSARGLYRLSVAVNYSDEVLIAERTIAVLNATMTVTPGDVEGQLKEAFGTSEFVYLTVKAKNETTSVNVSLARLDSLLYENGTYLTYTEKSTWDNVNGTNDGLEWAWNVTNQRLKVDAPKGGGSYFARVSADNSTIIGSVRFVVNPYESCIAAKTTAGTVTSGSSYYAWQYKVGDIVYFEVKLVQADNPLGKAAASNGSSTYSGYSSYGMGSACSFDTTKKQVVNNASLTLDEVVNTQTGIKANINLTASTCKADDESGGYTCTIRHANNTWDGGRYSVKLKVLGQDGKTSDIAYGLFEARAFYLWAWSNNWMNQPGSNITFNVRMYQAGSNWWNAWGTSGLSGNVKVEKIEYYGRQGEWIWPPVQYDYNISDLNETTVTNGAGTIFLNVTRAKKGSWDPGSYSVVLRGTENGGSSDFGQAWFEVRNWDSYANPVEIISGGTFAYKSYFGAKENITLYVRVTTAGDYGWTTGGSSLVADQSNITITVKKILDYSSWPAREINKSIYTASVINVNASSPWYSSATKASHSEYLLNLTLLKGETWNTGWFSVVLDINGTETGWGWFNAIAFYVNTQPVDIAGTYKYNHKGSGPVHFLVTSTRGYKNSYSHNTTSGVTDYVNTTIKDIKLRRWSDTDYRSIEYNYPSDFNITNAGMSTINYSRIVSLNHSSGTWPSGYYYGSMVLKNDDNESATGYIWFNVQDFRVQFTNELYTIGTNENITGFMKVLDPDWSNTSVIWGNYTITEIYQETWDYASRSKTQVTNFNPRNFNGSANISIAPPSSGWVLGWSNVVAVVYDNVTNTSKNAWIGFRAAIFTTTYGTVVSQDSITPTANVTIPVTLTAPRGGKSSGRLLRVYEQVWPNTYEYSFTTNASCTSVESTNCLINGSANVTLHVPSDGWAEEYHYLTFVLADANNVNSKSTESAPYFRVRPAYAGFFSNTDNNNTWRYHVGFTQDVLMAVTPQKASGSTVTGASIQYIQRSFTPGCYSDYCRVWTNVSVWDNYANRSDGMLYFRIARSGSWARGEHAIRVKIAGSLGNSFIKTGYFYARDTVAPNITSIGWPPYNGYKVNSTSLYLNVVTNEAATCSFFFKDYDTFYASSCGNTDDVVSNNSFLVGACNATLYNGSQSIYKSYYPPLTGLVTGGLNHTYTAQGINMYLTIDQDYAIQYYCYDSDSNSISQYRVIEMNATSNSTNITVLYTATQIAANAYLTGSSFLVNVSIGTGVANLTYELYNTTGLVNRTSVTNVTTAFTFYISNTDMLYQYNVTAFALNGSNKTTNMRNVTFDSTKPLVDYGVITSGNNTMYNRTWIYVNVTVTETNEANITFNLWLINHTVLNRTTKVAGTRTFNWTSLTPGNNWMYIYNVSVMDLATNINTTQVRSIYLNNTNSSVT